MIESNKKNIEIESWVKLYTKDLLKYAIYKTSDKEIAENLVQDTFEVVIKSYDTFQSKSSPKTWIYGIMNNKLKEFYKSKNNNTQSIQDFQLNDKNEYFEDNGDWVSNSVPKDWIDNENSHILDNNDFVEVFQKCIENLPESWRECIKMKYILNTKGTEICQIMSISQANFWQILHRAKLDLRKCLEISWFMI